MILQFLREVSIPSVYIAGIFIIIVTVIKNAEWGIFLMTAIIPQPNLYYKFYDLPVGKDFLDILFLAVVLGIFINKGGFNMKGNTILISLFLIISYLALWNSSMRFSLQPPISTDNPLMKSWKDYVMMISMYFVVMNAVKDENKQKIVVVIMALVILLISVRSFRNFTAGASFVDDSRYAGPFWIVGLGSNHLSAFIVHYSSALIGLFFFDKDWRRRWLYLAAILFSLHPLFFSYSRGGYMAAFAVIVFYGIMKKRSLLILPLVIILAWQTVLPASVVDRIMMTQTESGEFEESSALRLKLWDHAISLFKQNPIFGVGYGGFRFTVTEDISHYVDTHNYFIKTLSEQGLVGFALLLLIFYRGFYSGLRLYKIGRTPFHKGLGFGFLGCIVAVIITNMFGERWSYFVLNGYLWVLWGLVDRGILISKSVKDERTS